MTKGPGPSPAGDPPVVALFGPTGLGKTEIAVIVAERLGAEIVSADSMQVYRGLPVLTNQPADDQLTRVRHHLVAIVDPDHEFSAAEFAGLAHQAIAEITGRGRRVIVEGGAGLYMAAALGELHFGGAHDVVLRAELERRAAGDIAALRAELARRDPLTAARIDLANPRRVVRALEAVIVRGGPLPADEHDRLWSAPARYRHLLVALAPDRAALRDRVFARVEEMVARGLVDEVARLRALPEVSRTLRQAIGVREIGAHLDGSCALDEAVAAMQARTWRYVRRQLTWMRRLDAATIAVSGRSPYHVAEELLELVSANSAASARTATAPSQSASP
jgi:tRNA dimethylallyltransferase